MPELPDIEAYVSALRARVLKAPLQTVRLASPFLLRTAVPPLKDTFGLKVRGINRLGKRIVLSLDNDLHLVIHLMIAGRLQWKDTPDAPIPGGKRGLAAFDFPAGTLLFTEAGTKKRASLHVVSGDAGLAEHDPGGLEVLETGLAAFSERLRLRNHTLKRALTDPRLFSGIGNAYSDEILHHAGLSPIRMSQAMSDDEIARLHVSIKTVLREWTDRFLAEAEEAWPAKVTAFRPEMAAHGKYGKSCPACGTDIQRIRHAANETNYCPRCQTGGKMLADRSLSRLLKKDWPKTIEELELARKE